MLHESDPVSPRQRRLWARRRMRRMRRMRRRQRRRLPPISVIPTLCTLGNLIAGCAAMRLARFNVEMGPGAVNDHSLFRGLPSPGAAGTIASLVILHQHLLVVVYPDRVPAGFVQGAALGIPLIMLLCGFGMVSNIP